MTLEFQLRANNPCSCVPYQINTSSKAVIKTLGLTTFDKVVYVAV